MFYVVAILPYWFRFAQCIKKFHEGENQVGGKKQIHLINAGKYAVSILVPLSSILLSDQDDKKLNYRADFAFWLYVSLWTVKATYWFVYDIYVDWGLFRCFEPGPNRYLREKINYSPFFYWWAIVWNFILRYIWVLFLFNIGRNNTLFIDFKVMLLINIYCEAFRRA